MSRRRWALVFNLSVVLLCAMLSVAAPGAIAKEMQRDSRGELLRGVLPTVVSMTVRVGAGKSKDSTEAAASGDAGDKTEYGTGFVVDPSGVIVTNYHVVENAWDILVGFSDGTQLPGRLMRATRMVDVALVKVEAGHPLPAVAWGDSDKLLVGDPVVAIGNPFGVGISATGGIVSALNRDISDSPYDDFIQTDAAINHGNSGGPLFDMQGQVVGMNTALISPTRAASGLGFAIPSDTTQSIISRLEKYGWLRPGWVGMKVQQITTGMAHAFGMPKPLGSIVANITPGGPAEKGGLLVGDIIVRVSGVAPTDERALLRTVARTSVGDPISMVVLRGGQERLLTMTVAEWPKEQWDLLDPPVAMPPVRPIPADLGLSLEPVTAESTAKFGVADPRPGVLVTAVAPGTDAADRGMVPGDIIMRVMENEVSDPAAVERGFAQARSAGRDFVVVLVWPKVRPKPGPQWVALKVVAD